MSPQSPSAFPKGTPTSHAARETELYVSFVSGTAESIFSIKENDKTRGFEDAIGLEEAFTSFATSDEGTLALTDMVHISKEKFERALLQQIIKTLIINYVQSNMQQRDYEPRTQL